MMICPVCEGGGLIKRRDHPSWTEKPSWTIVDCPVCHGHGCETEPPQPLAVLAAQEAELHDGDCCDPDDAA